MDNDKIGKFIAKKRIEAGLTQNELGDKLFVTGKAVSKWERGLSLPDITILEKLAEVLNTDIHDILQIKKKKNIDLEKILEEERVKIQNQLRKKQFTILIPIVFIICIILFKLIPFGYYVDHIRYTHNTNKLINLGMPKFSFNRKLNEDSISYNNIRSKVVLENEVKKYLNTLKYLSCYDTIYYYDEITDTTIIDYSVRSNLLYSTISYSVRNGNYCDILIVDEYNKKLGGLNKIHQLHAEESNLNIKFELSYNDEETEKFEAYLSVIYYDKNKTILVEQSKGTFKIIDDELIYSRTSIKGDKKDIVPTESRFIIKNQNLILKDNYLKDYRNLIVIK